MFTSKAQKAAFVEASRLLRVTRSAAINHRKFVAATDTDLTDSDMEALTSLHNSVRDGRLPVGLPDSPCVLVLLQSDSIILLGIDGLCPGDSYARSIVKFGDTKWTYRDAGILLTGTPTMLRLPDDDGHANIALQTWVTAKLPTFDTRVALRNEQPVRMTEVDRALTASSLAVTAMQTLLLHSLPTGYLFRATARNQGLKRDRRLFKPGQDALIHIPFNRLWTIYGESFRQVMCDAPEPHRRRGHIRHHWKEAGLDRRFDIPLNPADRAALVESARVRRQWINPCWVGLPREGGDDWFEYALPRDVPLIDGPASAKPETDAA